MSLIVSGLADLIVAQPDFDPAKFSADDFFSQLSDDRVMEIFAAYHEREEFEKYNRFTNLFPDDGPLRRDLYPKHVEFFKAGKTFRERCFMAANRVGKTVGGGYESTCHLTGQYPHWWPGKVFHSPVRWWVAGDTNETTRDILQAELLGEVAFEGARKVMDGTGIIPKDCLGYTTWKSGVSNMVDTIKIKHQTGRWSKLSFKSFDQGRRVFQGTAKEGIWLDEECPEDVYGECLMRVATTRGMLLTTFTPLRGMSKVVLSFLPKEMRPDA